MLGLIDSITQKYKLGTPLGVYVTFGVHIVDGADDGILL